MSLGAIVMFTALLLGWKKYVGDKVKTVHLNSNQRTEKGV